jgi:hypothetical protein
MKSGKKAKSFRLLTLITPLAAPLITHYSVKTAYLLANSGFEYVTNPSWGAYKEGNISSRLAVYAKMIRFVKIFMRRQ